MPRIKDRLLPVDLRVKRLAQVLVYSFACALGNARPVAAAEQVAAFQNGFDSRGLIFLQRKSITVSSEPISHFRRRRISPSSSLSAGQSQAMPGFGAPRMIRRLTALGTRRSGNAEQGMDDGKSIPVRTCRGRLRARKMLRKPSSLGPCHGASENRAFQDHGIASAGAQGFLTQRRTLSTGPPAFLLHRARNRPRQPRPFRRAPSLKAHCCRKPAGQMIKRTPPSLLSGLSGASRQRASVGGIQPVSELCRLFLHVADGSGSNDPVQLVSGVPQKVS